MKFILEQSNALMTMEISDKLFVQEKRIYELEMDYKILKKELEERISLLEQMFETVSGSTFAGDVVQIMKAKNQRILTVKDDQTINHDN